MANIPMAEEFSGLDLGDVRLNKRAIKLADRLTAKPTASLPTACDSWNQLFYAAGYNPVVCPALKISHFPGSNRGAAHAQNSTTFQAPLYVGVGNWNCVGR